MTPPTDPRGRALAMLVVLLRGSAREIPLRVTSSEPPFARMVRIGHSWRVSRLPDTAGRPTTAALRNAYELMVVLNADIEHRAAAASARAMS